MMQGYHADGSFVRLLDVTQPQTWHALLELLRQEKAHMIIPANSDGARMVKAGGCKTTCNSSSVQLSIGTMQCEQRG
jgi:hypothetical protein